MFNEVLFPTMPKEVDYKNFSKVADLTVEEVKQKLQKVLNFVNKRPKVLTGARKTKEDDIHILRHGCVLRTELEKRMKDG